MNITLEQVIRKMQWQSRYSSDEPFELCDAEEIIAIANRPSDGIDSLVTMLNGSKVYIPSGVYRVNTGRCR